ncbi:MAG TPA: cupredoxin domain-containing protein [Gammaproteobacteria bacterium]|nr:cupredoxin domain-containing protein [Gammaproteobacteria bacterium]
MKTWLVAAVLVCTVPPIHATAPRSATIHIGNFTFSPAVIEVPAGTSLTWVNEDDAPHTVVGSDRDSPLRSPALDTDDRYDIVLSRPGTYRYFCSLHPHMTGTIVVK